jgi:hypothetical protein
MKKVLFVLVLLMVAGGWWMWGKTTVQAPSTAQNQAEESSGIVKTAVTIVPNPTPNPLADLIQVTSPVLNATVTSPLVATGQARGNWYFEASFPVELRDANGLLLAQKPATALSDWMTTNWVPFTVTLTFPTPATATGTLIFRKDNPSGEPANDASYSVPVTF